MSFLTVVLAIAVALWIDRSSERRGLQPPGLHLGAGRPARRGAALMGLSLALYLAVFQPIEGLASATPPSPPTAVWPLFWVHGVLLLALVVWWGAGFVGLDRDRSAGAPTGSRLLGLSVERFGRELAIGVGAGVVAWLGVLAMLLVVGSLVTAWGAEALLPEHPPALVVWVAALPVAVRVAVSLSAGFVEELFFRGLLQARIGVGASTVLFAVAHLGYRQPFLLLGVVMLSFGFAGLVRWRRNLWPAIAAHAVFDGVQLLVLIPWVLRVSGAESPLVAPVD